jgi:hypothetical protein
LNNYVIDINNFMNSTDRLVKGLPYIRGLFGDDDIQKINNKYELFDNASISKDKKVQRLSVTNKYDYDMENIAGGGRVSNMYYHQLMYNSTSDDKKRRIDDYRSMANFSEVERALREICNEFFEVDDKGQTLKIKLRGDHNEEVQMLIEEEFHSFLEIFKFEDKGRKFIWDWLIEGELFFENIISVQKPELGIIGLTRIASERCDPLYYDLDNELIDCFLLRNKSPDMYPFQWGKFTAQASYGSNNKHQILFLNEKQITYIAKDQWSDGKKYKLPVFAYAHRPYRQLSLIEDATIIYMLVRAPERLVFNVDVGNMQPSKADQYLKRMMAQFWSKKTITQDGRMENVYDPQGMMENFWFPMRQDGKGSTVDSIGGGKASPDNLEILNFFVQKLYLSLKVPLSRLNSDTAFSDGESITREELGFAEYIIDLQKLWAAAVKRSFIVHLKLKGKKLLEVANKIKMDEVTKVNANGTVSAFKVSQVFKDSFNEKCWEYYDVLSEEINLKIDEQEKLLAEQYDTLLEELSFTTRMIEGIDKNLVLEENDSKLILLQEDIVRIENEIESVKSKQENLSDNRDDMTSWWEQYALRVEDLDVKFVEPSQFFALRQQQLFQLKYDNFNNMSQNDFVSNTFAQKVYLGWNDREILANRDFLLKDAAFRWELSQIEQNGPDFREKALEEIQAATEGGGGDLGIGAMGSPSGGGGGPSLPSPSGGSDTNLPEFGQSSEGGDTPDAGGGEEAGGETEEAEPSVSKPPSPAK